MKNLIFVAFLAVWAASLEGQAIGISPEDDKYYMSSDVIKCKDGSGEFTRPQLNDDFCDCPDGSDEPGTSACPHGKFFCRNAGHTPLLLFSSRVNDGICDCCDGSDEYDGKVKCTNTCWEAGKVARQILEKKVATYQEGVAIRKGDIEQGKTSLLKDEEDLLRLKDEERVLKDLVQQLRERKEQIEKAEERERLQREKEEKERKEVEEKADKEKSKDDVDTGAKNEDGEVKVEGEDVETGSQYDDKIGLVDDPPLDQNVVDDFPEEGQAEDATSVKEPPGSKPEQHTGGDGTSLPASHEKEHKAAPETVTKAGTEPSDKIPAEEGGSSEKTEGLSKEELGRLVASRWTGEKVEKEGDQSAGTHEPEKAQKDTQIDDSYASENYDGDDVEGDDDDVGDDDKKYGYGNDDEKYGYGDDDKKYGYSDDDAKYGSDEDLEYEDNYKDSYSYSPKPDYEADYSDVDTKSNPSWLDKIKQTVQNLLQAVNLMKQTPVDKSEADRVRQEYDSSNTKLSKLQSKILSLEEKLKLDFGPEKEFYSFYGRCFESKQNKYTYKVCPFREATQEEGYSRTRLGDWDKFGDSYKAMLFANGEKCWNGPDRSLKVKLRCGLTNELTDVDEPSRCEYVALLATPALCSEDRLTELRHKLDAMNKEQPQEQGHDEL